MKRREFLAVGTTAMAAMMAGHASNPVAAGGPTSAAGEVFLEPQPLFELSPYLYMQFMEPLGKTDGSVAVAWDSEVNRWCGDVLRVTRELGPTLMRWGGCFSSYYRWKEAVGPRKERIPVQNLLWGGTESNQVGTVEFVDFCRQVGADPLMGVNFESDGRRRWMRDPAGRERSAGPEEAAEWVDCTGTTLAPRQCGSPSARRGWTSPPAGLATASSSMSSTRSASGRLTRTSVLRA